MRARALALLLVLPAVSRAQEAFPDVPKNHWAYAALARMRAEGLLVGYPDGLFRGGRPATRYELAVALHAAYARLKDLTDGLNARVRSLGAPAGAGDLKAAVDALRRDLAGMKRDDLADLQRAADTFELELTQLGIDAQAMKDELRGLAGRVAALERREDPLRIGGTIDLWAGGGHTDGRRYGLTRDGRLTGTSDKGPQAPGGPLAKAGITRDLAFLSEAAFEFETTRETGVKVRGTLVATNAFGQNPVGGLPTRNVAFGNQSDVFNPTGGFGLLGYAEGSGDLYLQDLVLSGRSRGVDWEAGRLEAKATPWILQRIDNTLYFDQARWDDGLYTFDGLKGAFRLGGVEAQVYGGVDQERSVNGVRVDTIRSGPPGGIFAGGAALDARFETGRLLGATLATRVRGVGLRGDWLALDGDETFETPRGALDQLQVFGGEADARIGRLRLSGGLRQTQGREGGGRVEGLAGNAWDAKAAYRSGRFDLWAQYRQVQTEYLAPGDWGRLGILRNPTNVRGLLGAARVDVARRLDLGLEGEISHGLSDGGAAGTGFARGTDIGRYAAHLGYAFLPGWSATVRYENTVFHDFALPVGGDPRYQWYGVGLARALGGDARFTLDYEQSAIRHDPQTSLGAAGLDYRGGFLTTQVSVRF